MSVSQHYELPFRSANSSGRKIGHLSALFTHSLREHLPANSLGHAETSSNCERQGGQSEFELLLYSRILSARFSMSVLLLKADIAPHLDEVR
jgi:hypothetical protein